MRIKIPFEAMKVGRQRQRGTKKYEFLIPRLLQLMMSNRKTLTPLRAAKMSTSERFRCMTIVIPMAKQSSTILGHNCSTDCRDLLLRGPWIGRALPQKLIRFHPRPE